MNFKLLCCILILSTMLLQASCVKKEYNEPFKLFEAERDIYGEEVDVAGLQKNIPIDMIIIDSLLIIHDQYNINDTAFFFSIVNHNNNELVKYFGKEGRGPNDFLFPSIISRIPKKPATIGVNNRRLFSFSELSVDKILSESSDITISLTNELSTDYSMIVKINDDRFVGTGFFEDGRFGISDREGNFLFSQYSYPFQETFDNVGIRTLGMAFQSNLVTHPTKNMMAATNFSSANIDFFSFSNDSLETIKSIHLNPPLVENSSSENMLSAKDLPENKRGYESLASTSNFVYALYSGIKRKEGLDKYLTGQVVFQFDWKGNAIKQYNLEHPAKLIAVDKEDKYLFAMSPDSTGENILLKYKLN